MFAFLWYKGKSFARKTGRVRETLQFLYFPFESLWVKFINFSLNKKKTIMICISSFVNKEYETHNGN